MARRPMIAAAVAIVLAGALSGCQTPLLTRAGLSPAPTVLRIVTADAPGRFTDDVIAAFSERVAHDSGATLELRLDRLPDDSSRWNQETAQRVIDGEDELGIVPAQAWDAFDVATFTALYVPFAVTSDDLIDAVAQDDLAADMLAGLEPLGVTGLALVPGGVRHTFRVETPFDDPASYASEGVRVAYSTAVWQYFDAIGARPLDPNGAAGRPLVESGELTGFDAMFRFVDSLIDEPATTADTASHPHALTIAANTSALSALTTAQRSALARAAAETVSWSVKTRLSDAEEAASLCARAPGAVVANAGPDAVAALHAAARPVIDRLLAQPVVARFADRIARLDARLGHPSSAIAPCRGPVLTHPGPAPPNRPAVFPEGEYRRLVTVDELTAAGLDRTTVLNHSGLLVLSLHDGVVDDPGCPGTTYAVRQDRFEMTLGESGDECGDAAGEVLFSGGWRLDGDQLTFTAVESGSGADLLVRTLFGGGPWTKVR